MKIQGLLPFGFEGSRDGAGLLVIRKRNDDFRQALAVRIASICKEFFSLFFVSFFYALCFGVARERQDKGFCRQPVGVAAADRVPGQKKRKGAADSLVIPWCELAVRKTSNGLNI